MVDTSVRPGANEETAAARSRGRPASSQSFRHGLRHLSLHLPGDRPPQPLIGLWMTRSPATTYGWIQKGHMRMTNGLARGATGLARSDLAVGAAARLGMTLVGFLRADGFNVYARPDRVAVGRA